MKAANGQRPGQHRPAERRSIGAAARTTAPRSGPAAALALLVVLATLAACDAPAAGGDPAKVRQRDAQAFCPELQSGPAGICCAAGMFYDHPTFSCASAGPPECAHLLPNHAADCVPRWCWDWQREDGSACPPDELGCIAAGRICGDEERAQGRGCPAGEFSDSGLAADCRPAGEVTLPGGAVLPATATPPDYRIVPGVSATPSGCPRGFVSGPPVILADVDPAAPLPPSCQPDPAECGTGPFAIVPKGPGVVFVDPAYKGPSPSGTREQPFVTLAAGVDAVLEGGTLVLAAGDFGSIAPLKKGIAIVGRCAAMTHLGIVEVKLDSAEVQARVDGVTLQRLSVASGQVDVRRSRVAQGTWTHSSAIAYGPEARLSMADVVMDGLPPRPYSTSGDALVGSALGAGNGAKLEVTDARIGTDHAFGIVCQDANSRVTATRTAFVGMGVPSGLLHSLDAPAIGAMDGGQIEVSDALFLRPAWAYPWVTKTQFAGVALAMGKTAVRLSRVAVVGHTVGMEAKVGARVDVRDAFADGSGAFVTGEFEGKARLGGFLGVFGHANGSLRRARLHDIPGSAIYAYPGKGTTLADLRAADVLLDATRADPVSAGWVPAVYCNGGGRLRLSAAHLRRTVAVAAQAVGGSLHLAGVRISDTRVADDGRLGSAVVGIGAKIAVSGSRVEGSSGAAVIQLGGSLVMDGLSAATIDPGLVTIGTPAGDGVIVGYSANATLHRLVVHGAARAGVLVDSSNVAVTDTLLATTYFGYALQNAATWTALRLALPGAVIPVATDAGLALPAAPDLVPPDRK